jgi:glycerol-3-phosphate dehydrogenase
VLEIGTQEGIKDYRIRTLEVINRQVIWSVKYEMARTVEDFSARRTRCQLLMQKKV